MTSKDRLKALELRAKTLTRHKLADLQAQGLHIPCEWAEKLILEIGVCGANRVFEIVLPGAVPEDSIVLTSVQGDIETGELGEVTVFTDRFCSRRA